MIGQDELDSSSTQINEGFILESKHVSHLFFNINQEILSLIGSKASSPDEYDIFQREIIMTLKQKITEIKIEDPDPKAATMVKKSLMIKPKKSK